MKAIKERGSLFSLASACKHKHQNKKRKKANTQPARRRIEIAEPVVELENSQSLSSEYYDDGMPLVLQYSKEENEEHSFYPSNEIEDIEFVESKKSNSFDYNEGYVEPFEAEILNNETVEEQAENFQKINPITELKEAANQNLGNDNVSNSKQNLKEEKQQIETIQKSNSEILRDKNKKENSVKDHSSDEILKAITESEADDSFENDIKAILSGSKKYDSKQKKVLPASGSATSSPSGSNQLFGEDGKMPEFKNNQHDIFNKIAQNLSFSNSYDLGSIALDHKFDSFDKEIEEVDVKKKVNH